MVVDKGRKFGNNKVEDKGAADALDALIRLIARSADKMCLSSFSQHGTFRFCNPPIP